jgi:hypothetical protein
MTMLAWLSWVFDDEHHQPRMGVLHLGVRLLTMFGGLEAAASKFDML